MIYSSWGQVAWGAFLYDLRFATADHTHSQVGFLILLHLAAVLIKNKH